MEFIQSLGVGGILAIIILKEFLNHISQKKPDHFNKKLDKICEDVKIIKRESRDLHQWHDREDNEGVKIWYTRNKTIEIAISKIADSLEKQTDILQKLLAQRSN